MPTITEKIIAAKEIIVLSNVPTSGIHAIRPMIGAKSRYHPSTDRSIPSGLITLPAKYSFLSSPSK